MIEHHLLVLSDSHGHTRHLHDILARQVQRPDALLFLGDGLRDLRTLELERQGIILHAVKGNCDGTSFSEPDEPTERLLTIGNVRICMMHGHLYHVKSGWQMAAAYAARRGADLLLFGHTHIPLEEHLPTDTVLGGITLNKPLTVFNPGTAGGGWGSDATFGTLTIRNGILLCGHGKL